MSVHILEYDEAHGEWERFWGVKTADPCAVSLKGKGLDWF